jgi:putative ABC transport system ATP-binding protein
MDDTTRLEGPTERDRQSDETAVRLVGVTHEYDAADGRIQAAEGRTVIALDDVSFDLERGETVCLSGPSGSGKSTVLHAIAGLLVPTAGTVELFGTDLTALAPRERLRARRQHVGIVFQQFHLLQSLSARANVAVPLIQEGVPRAKRRTRAADLLERVGLEDRELHRPAQLSGGERQRVAIARALVTDPDVIVADEPTGELDTATGRRVLDALTRAAGDRVVLFASHDDQTRAVCDRVIRLRDGRVIGSGS